MCDLPRDPFKFVILSWSTGNTRSSPLLLGMVEATVALTGASTCRAADTREGGTHCHLPLLCALAPVEAVQHWPASGPSSQRSLGLRDTFLELPGTRPGPGSVGVSGLVPGIDQGACDEWSSPVLLEPPALAEGTARDPSACWPSAWAWPVFIVTQEHCHQVPPPFCQDTGSRSHLL